MKIFHPGDRVTLIRTDSEVATGEVGTVLGYWDPIEDYNDTNIVSVRWDEHSNTRHDCKGLCEMGHGWNVWQMQLEFIEEIPITSIDVGQLI